MNLGSVRDLSIIILALESLVVGVLLSVLIVQVTRLIRMLRDEVMPILYSTQETLGTVRGTATFVSDRVVQPVVKVSSYTAGVRQAVSVLFGRNNGRG
jgi:hypothetical protein